MARNYDRSYEKENSYEADSFALGKGKHSTNTQLRKKLEQNIALTQRDVPNTIDSRDLMKPMDSSCLPISTKRENARRRGFDMKISNIDTINDKISGLLNMVKKDRQQNEVKQTTRQENNQKEVEREVNRNLNYNITNRWKRFNDSNSKNDHSSHREDAIISNFNDNIVPDRRGALYQPEVGRQEHSSKYQEEQTFKESEDIRTIRMRYLEEDSRRDKSSNNRIVKNSQLRQRKAEQVNAWWEDVLQQESHQKYQRSDKPKGKIEEGGSINEQKKAIDQMIEDRRKERLKVRQFLRETSQDRVISKSRSVIKYKEDFQLPVKSSKELERDSPIIKVTNQRFQSTIDDNFANIRTPISRKNSREPQGHFTELTYIEEDTSKQEKISCTAKLIDEQLMRIKQKINESEVNKKRMESFRPTSNEDYKGKEHTMRIAQSISNQVKFDSHLKQARECFEKIPGESKWEDLEKMALEKGLKLQSKVLRELVKIGPDEHNPFGGEKSTISMQEMIELLAAAQKNWENCVLKCGSRRNLNSEGFEVSDLDLNNKGYLGPQDLVCFVNLYVNSFYRNRDLALVTRRLQFLQGGYCKNGIEYGVFLQAFSV